MITGLYLADTSATQAARSNPDLADRLNRLMVAGLLATCLPLDLEAGYSATSPTDHQLIAAQRRELLIELPNSPEVAARAREIQASLAAAGQHRAAGAVDIMVAAFALTHQATVLHRDRDYEIIASVTGLAVERVP
ncbi:MAG TPA: PIN domain-containing protein [Natronosporangium sp.]